jgi:hypothetical protein
VRSFAPEDDIRRGLRLVPAGLAQRDLVRHRLLQQAQERIRQLFHLRDDQGTGVIFNGENKKNSNLSRFPPGRKRLLLDDASVLRRRRQSRPRKHDRRGVSEEVQGHG